MSAERGKSKGHRHIPDTPADFSLTPRRPSTAELAWDGTPLHLPPDTVSIQGWVNDPEAESGDDE